MRGSIPPASTAASPRCRSRSTRRGALARALDAAAELSATCRADRRARHGRIRHRRQPAARARARSGRARRRSMSCAATRCPRTSMTATLAHRVLEQRQHRRSRRPLRRRRSTPAPSASRSRPAAACSMRRASTAARADVRVGRRAAVRARLELRVAAGDLRTARPDSGCRGRISSRRSRTCGRSSRRIDRDVPEAANPAKQLARRLAGQAAACSSARRRWRPSPIAGARRSTRTRSPGRSPTSCRR